MKDFIGKTFAISKEVNFKKCFYCESGDYQFERINELDSYESIEKRACNKCNSEWLVSHFFGEIYYVKDIELQNNRRIL